MGLTSSNDEWCGRSDVILHNVDDAQRIVDDVLIAAPDLPTLLTRAHLLLTQCREEGVAMSSKKIQIGESIGFAGYVVTPDGADPEKMLAIAQFPTLTNIKDVCSFLGLANQLGGLSLI